MNIGSAIDLVDLPLIIPHTSVNINATLTDSNAGNKYFIQESISASDASIKGGIVISGEKDSYNIYYNTDSDFNKERLVIHGTNCLPFTYNNKWDQTLPGLKEPVTNLILLMGPSILYRLDHSSLVWKTVEDRNIRGTLVKVRYWNTTCPFWHSIPSFDVPKLAFLNTLAHSSTYCEYFMVCCARADKIEKKLSGVPKRTKDFDDDSGIKHPSRIEFSGYDPSSS
uniref:Uncharacterized protein n=1 Tax=Tetranychus urticae TaxID=32264 RepID=T1JY31_TETUR